MKKGKALRPGDTIGIVATSSPAQKNESVEAAIEEAKSLGFRVKVSQSCYEIYGGYLAGTPEFRAQEVNKMFADPEVDGIICFRGGYGSPQILPLLDYELISANPKLLVGYSDITALHIALGQNAGLATVHGPNVSSGLETGVHPLTRESLLRVLTNVSPLGPIINPPEEKIGSLVGGKASGPIVGGNLCLISATMGTPYELDTKGKLLFLEDIGEDPYRIDRMLTQLALAGKFDDAAGIVIGTWTKCSPVKYPEGFQVMDVIESIIPRYQKPTIYNLQVGHGEWNISLPLGVEAILDADEGILRIEESVTA